MLGPVPRPRPFAPLLVVLAACTPVEPPPSTQTPREVEVATPDPLGVPEVERVEPDDIASQALDALWWRWQSTRPVDEDDSFSTMPVSIANGSTVIEATELEDGVQITRKDGSRLRWTTTLGERQSDAAALAFAGDAVMVVHYRGMATGAEAARLDWETGEVEWAHPLQGVGPVGHSKYRNAVQAELVAGVLHVYGRESFGAYVEHVDVHEGTSLAHALVPHELVGLPWEPPMRTGPQPVHGFGIQDGVGGSVSIEGEPAAIVHRPAEGKGITVALPHDPGSCLTGDGLVRDGVAYLVVACRITSGAEALAVSLSSGEILWRQALHGLGPIAHSAYSNDVRLSWQQGVVLVHGDEAMGQYVEALEPKDGRLLVTKTWPASR